MISFSYCYTTSARDEVVRHRAPSQAPAIQANHPLSKSCRNGNASGFLWITDAGRSYKSIAVFLVTDLSSVYLYKTYIAPLKPPFKPSCISIHLHPLIYFFYRVSPSESDTYHGIHCCYDPRGPQRDTFDRFKRCPGNLPMIPKTIPKLTNKRGWADRYLHDGGSGEFPKRREVCKCYLVCGCKTLIAVYLNKSS